MKMELILLATLAIVFYLTIAIFIFLVLISVDEIERRNYPDYKMDKIIMVAISLFWPLLIVTLIFKFILDIVYSFCYND